MCRECLDRPPWQDIDHFTVVKTENMSTLVWCDGRLCDDCMAEEVFKARAKSLYFFLALFYLNLSQAVSLLSTDLYFILKSFFDNMCYLTQFNLSNFMSFGHSNDSQVTFIVMAFLW